MHMKYVISGTSCSWTGLASCLAPSGSCRLAGIDWLGWAAPGREGAGQGSCETAVEVKATKKLRKSKWL